MAYAFPICSAVYAELRDKFCNGICVILRDNPDKESENWEYNGIGGFGRRPEVLAHSEKDESLEQLIARFRKENPDATANVFAYKIGSGWIANSIKDIRE